MLNTQIVNDYDINVLVKMFLSLKILRLMVTLQHTFIAHLEI